MISSTNASCPILGCSGQKVIHVFVYGSCGRKVNNTNGGIVFCTTEYL